MERLSFKDRVTNEEVVGRLGEKWRVLDHGQEGKLVGTLYAGNTR